MRTVTINSPGFTANAAGIFLTQPRFLAFAGMTCVVPLLLSLRYPLLAWRIAFGLYFVVPTIPSLPNASITSLEFLILILMFAIAAWGRSRATLAWLLVLMTFCAWWETSGALKQSPVWPSWLQPAVYTIAIVAVAFAVDAASASQRAHRELADQTQRANEEESRRAVLEERTRIARELHDVVAHHLSLITVQTETARYRMPALPSEAFEELESISERAREALVDMRTVLGVLRSDGEVERAPQPRLGDVRDLVDSTQHAGVKVSLSMSDEPLPVSASVGLSAYRIVQEALSNASQHSSGSPVRVSIDGDAGRLQLRVSNRVSAHSPKVFDSSRKSYGLKGMRERVALLGGTMVAGTDANGEFVVAVELPLAASGVS